MIKDSFSNKAEAFEAFDDTPLSPAHADAIGAVIARRFSRRDLLKGSLGVAAATALFGDAALQSALAQPKPSSTFSFAAVPAGVDERSSLVGSKK
jgi:secreted PhoX family phosphatase